MLANALVCATVPRSTCSQELIDGGLRIPKLEDTPSRRDTIMSDLQQQVQEAIDRLVESGAERGLQVAVYRHGEPVVDAVAGVADPATGRPVTSDTLFYAYSTGKGATATVAHMLVERGVFGYDTPIVELWPESWKIRAGPSGS
jgi:CubicO group peptidase (beta-lactamase class C family)